MIDNPTLQAIAISTGASLIVALFAKFFPKKKLIGMIKVPCVNLGRGISKFLCVRLGKKAAERIEEGFIVTVLQVAGEALLFVVSGILEDNRNQCGKNGGSQK